MKDAKVWLITGASRGMGVSFTTAVLEAGHAVVATGRRPSEVADAVGVSDRLLVTALDVTSVNDATAAAAAAVERFGRIDVLVNNAGASFKGYFEEMSPAQVEQQLAVNLLGPMNVTRAVLPVMRRQRSGHVVSISSGAGLIGFEYSSVYAASKSGLEGWMCALGQEVEPFGIRTAALLAIVEEDPPPRRFIAGADVIALANRKIRDLEDDIESHRELSESLLFD